MSRGVADELVVASVLAPMMATNLGAKLMPRLFASDASLAKGAIVSTSLSDLKAALLWRTSERKGGYSRLDGGPRALRKVLWRPCA